MGRDKLSYLWQHRRTKAIDIILNNSTYPNPPPAANNVELVQQYYTDKCNKADHAPIGLQDTPWQHQFTCSSTEADCELQIQAFTETEVEKIMRALPNNKASGYDGVTYETIKATKQASCPALTNIFNACLINGKVPDSWKGALIIIIPKKDNVPDDPSTMKSCLPAKRPISVDRG